MKTLTYADVVARLRTAGCVFAEDEAQMLLSAASGAELDRMLGLRESGVPLEQVVGWAEFCGRRIVVEPTVFVPRRRTELLVDEALRRCPSPRVVVDLCCGSGVVAAVLAARLPDADVYAADVDPPAVRCARRNLAPERVFLGDLYSALPDRLRGRVEVLVANAPYVPTTAIALMPSEARVHEARVALDGGADGLDLHRRIAAAAGEWLTPGGWLLIETSARQAASTAELAARGGLLPDVVRDDERDATVVAAQAPR
jgi:release factor glutamine methyltransferase